MRTKLVWALLAGFFGVAVYAGTVLRDAAVRCHDEHGREVALRRIDLNAHAIPATSGRRG